MKFRQVNLEIQKVSIYIHMWVLRAQTQPSGLFFLYEDLQTKTTQRNPLKIKIYFIFCNGFSKALIFSLSLSVGVAVVAK